MIPHRLIRTVPHDTTPEVEGFWTTAGELHAGWDLVTYRDPIDPSWFPLTAKHWARCTSGAQLAGLIRLEALWHRGGVYLDSDVECYRSFTPLTDLRAFAGWEDPGVIPDAVLGAEPEHPAIRECLSLALRRLHSEDPDWRVGSGAWGTGPGVTTTVLGVDRGDVLVLPPGSFYPYHYSERHRRNEDHRAANPWAFCAHHWNASWLQGGDVVAQNLKLNTKGVNELLHSPGVKADLAQRAQRVADAAGEGMIVVDASDANRARSIVVTSTAEAMVAEANSRKLTQAIDAAR